MLPCLPLDVIINIFYSLPEPSRSSHDIGPRTLSACSQVNSLFREAASLSLLWKDYYLTRYEQSNEDEEQKRISKCQQHWGLMYRERRRIDVLVLKQLDQLIATKKDRQKMMDLIVEGSMDVWDVLELETKNPIPPTFDPLASHDPDVDRPEHALTRHYWAKSLLETVSRGWAIKKWQAIAVDSDNQALNASTFEDSMTTLSCFFGFPPKRITDEFDKLAKECRLYLSSNKITLNPRSPHFNLTDVCKQICAFMSSLGFSRLDDDHYYFNIMNNFPHSYLFSRKKTLPISLVHIFVSLCRRLGIQAFPINFPGTVLAHIASTDPRGDPVCINPSAPGDDDIVVTESSPIITALGVPFQTVTQYLTPSAGLPMLVRASRNILGMAVSRIDTSPYVDHSAILVPLCTHLMFTLDRRTVASLLEAFKFDLPEVIFLQKYVLPLVVGNVQRLLQDYCDVVLQKEEYAENKVATRNEATKVKYFVGMPFRHVKYGYLGVITGWDETCLAGPEWIAKMQVDSLPSGQNQPFYQAIAHNGTERYVAEENITPSTISAQYAKTMHEQSRQISRHFEDVQLPTDAIKGVNHPEGRGRFLLNPHSRQTYPDDESVAQRWIERGMAP